MAARIALIGYRGSGKTTVGRLLAEQLVYAFADSDDLVEQQHGKSIAAIFAEEGEEVFRAWEESAITTLLEQDKLVLATGGGAVLRESTRRRLRQRAFVIWLDADPAILAARVAADPTTAQRRPALTESDPIREIEAVWKERRPWYARVAHRRLDVSQTPPEELVDALVRERPWQS